MKKIDSEKTSIENDDNILTNVKTETEIKEVKQMSKDDDLTKTSTQNEGNITANAKPKTNETIYTFGEGYTPAIIPKEEERIRRGEEYIEELVNGIYRDYEISRKARRDFNTFEYQKKYHNDLENLFFATHALFTEKRILREYKKYLANKENEEKIEQNLNH
jgi:hypothetical protein